MQLNDWKVIKHNNTRIMYYGEISEYLEENKISESDIEIISPDDWTTSEIVEITGNLLEDVNKHHACYLPARMKDFMTEAEIEPDKMKKFFTLYMNEMFKNYGY